jgi:hypothetical protein
MIAFPAFLHSNEDIFSLLAIIHDGTLFARLRSIVASLLLPFSLSRKYVRHPVILKRKRKRKPKLLLNNNFTDLHF